MHAWGLGSHSFVLHEELVNLDKVIYLSTRRVGREGVGREGVRGRRELHLATFWRGCTTLFIKLLPFTESQICDFCFQISGLTNKVSSFFKQKSEKSTPVFRREYITEPWNFGWHIPIWLIYGGLLLLRGRGWKLLMIVSDFPRPQHKLFSTTWLWRGFPLRCQCHQNSSFQDYYKPENPTRQTERSRQDLQTQGKR